jgi:protein O-mannosyl-transferase
MGSRKQKQKRERSQQAQRPSPPQTLLWIARPHPKLYRTLLLVGLAALTLAVYGRAFGFGVIDLDDNDYVGDNLYVNHGLTPSSIAWAFSGFHVANWIPLTWLSLMLDASLFGRWPEGNHIVNVLLHTVNVLLVFATFAKATGSTARSAFVAALFAVHPLHVESVAWISERKDVLSMLFGLLALLEYVSYASGQGERAAGRGRKLIHFALAWLFLAFSLMAKQTFVTLPFLFLLLDYWPLGRMTDGALKAAAGKRGAQGAVPPHPPAPLPRGERGERLPAGAPPLAVLPSPLAGEGPDFGELSRAGVRGTPRRMLPLVLEKLPFFALTTIFCIVAVFAQASGGAIPTVIPLGTRLLNAVFCYGFYLWKALFPIGLAPFYPYPAQGPDVVGVIFSFVTLAAITAFAVVSIRKRPYFITGWLWYLGSFVPVIGIVQIGRQQMADRYAYLPLLGIYLAIAWLVPSLIREPTTRKRYLPIAAAVVVACYSVAGFVQVGYWHDGVTLFQRALAVTEDNPTTRRALGSALFRRERFREALPHLEQAVKQNPSDAHAHYSLGRGWEATGHPQEAFAEYQAALALDEAYPDAQNDVGLSLVDQGKFADAERHFKRAIEIDPAFASGYGNLGMLYGRLGQSAKAIESCEKALRLDPTLLQCHQTIATVLAGEGRFDEAIARLEALLKMEPGNQDARAELTRISRLKEAQRASDK